MIQVEEGQDRGQALYGMFPSAIAAMAKKRVETYFSSPQYSGLKNNCRMMDLYIDNAAPSVASMISDITPPTIRRAYNEFSSLFHKFLETDPLFSAVKTEKVPEISRRAAQMVVNDNLDKTYYRERSLIWTIDDIIRYGTAVTYSFGTSDYNANSLMTVKGDEYGDYSQVYGAGENVAVSTPIHPLNTIVDPRASFQTAPEYVGFIGDICFSAIKKLGENPAYIGENIKKVIAEGKNGLPSEYWYAGEGKDRVNDYSKGHSNIIYLWMRLPFDGNEDDPTWYAIEMIGNYIIRIEENPLDGNTIPLAIKRIFPRKYQWYGNSPLIDKISVQNLQYLLINTTVESTTRLMDRMIIYREGSLDVESISSRHQTGGLIPYRGQEQNLDKLMYGVQLPAVGFRESDWLMQEMRREDQETSMIPNFNPQSEGGPTNKTLGGAQMMASIGEMRASFLVNQMCVGMKDVAKHQLVILRNIIADEIQTMSGQVIPKEQILGDVTFNIKISNVYNYIREGIDAENRLNNLINRRATQIPQFMAIPLGPMIKDSLRNGLKRENISDYVNEELLDALDQRDAQSVMQPPAPPMPPPGGAPGPTPPPPSPPPSPIQEKPNVLA
jgi:hypothetical protein